MGLSPGEWDQSKEVRHPTQKLQAIKGGRGAAGAGRPPGAGRGAWKSPSGTRWEDHARGAGARHDAPGRPHQGPRGDSPKPGRGREAGSRRRARHPMRRNQRARHFKRFDPGDNGRPVWLTPRRVEIPRRRRARHQDPRGGCGPRLNRGDGHGQRQRQQQSRPKAPVWTYSTIFQLPSGCRQAVP